MPRSERPFRFGVVAATARTGAEWVARAGRVESLGYSTLLVPDGLRFTLAPFPALAVAAAATRTLRLGTYVIANDFRNPVLLARDVASLDLLSDGRVELGIGAGRPGAVDDNRMLGMPFDSGAVRLARLAESLTLLNRLLAGQPSEPAGDFYQLDRAQIGPLGPQQPRPPLLIAASGPRMLELAAHEADIVALGIAPTATDADLGAVVERLAAAAGERFAHLELNLNLMAVGQQVPRYLEMQLELNASQLAAMGSAAALPGSVDEMCARLRHLRETFGISYIVVGDELMEGLAPVVERLTGT